MKKIIKKIPGETSDLIFSGHSRIKSGVILGEVSKRINRKLSKRNPGHGAMEKFSKDS